MNMTSNEKTLNYEIDLVENYNFHIKFTSIRVHAKNLQFFERKLKN
jgi:transposase